MNIWVIEKLVGAEADLNTGDNDERTSHRLAASKMLRHSQKACLLGGCCEYPRQ